MKIRGRARNFQGINLDVREVVMLNSLQLLVEISKQETDKWAISNAIKASFDAYYPEIDLRNHKYFLVKLTERLAEILRTI